MIILNIASNTITMIQAYTGTTNAIATETLGGSTMYFQSATQLNTIYVITNELNETLSYYSGFYSVIKINFVTPSVTYLFSANYYYGNVWSYFIDFSYDTIGTSAYYDVLFMHSQPSTNTQFDIELLRFNDTNFVNDWQLAYFDSNMLSNKPVGCIVPNGCWGTGQLSTVGSGSITITPLYIGSLANIYGDNIHISGINTLTPTYTSAPTGAYIWYNANEVPFSSYANSWGYISPYGYGNMWQITTGSTGLCLADYLIATTPSTVLFEQWNISPITGTTQILPTTTQSYALSQNVSYVVTASLLVGGVVQTSGTYSIFSVGENTNQPFNNGFTNPIATNAVIQSNGAMTINIPFTNTMTSTPTYDAYQITVIIGTGATATTYIFTMSLTWFFQDKNGVPLPNTYSGQGSGNTNPNSGNGNTNGTSAFTNYWVVIIVYVIFSVFFALVAGRDGLVIGLMLSTIICGISNLLPIWVIMLDAIGIIFLILDKTNVLGGT